MTDGRKTLMHCTTGINTPNLTRHPLGDEGEMSSGPDYLNPHRSAEEAELIEEIEAKERHREDSELFKTGRNTADMNDDVADPTENDPFAFDDLDPDLPAFGEQDVFGIETISPFNDDGPQF